jgi:hypothetical protein
MQGRAILGGQCDHLGLAPFLPFFYLRGRRGSPCQLVAICTTQGAARHTPCRRGSRIHRQTNSRPAWNSRLRSEPSLPPQRLPGGPRLDDPPSKRNQNCGHAHHQSHPIKKTCPAIQILYLPGRTLLDQHNELVDGSHDAGLLRHILVTEHEVPGHHQIRCTRQGKLSRSIIESPLARPFRCLVLHLFGLGDRPLYFGRGSARPSRTAVILSIWGVAVGSGRLSDGRFVPNWSVRSPERPVAGPQGGAAFEYS